MPHRKYVNDPNVGLFRPEEAVFEQYRSFICNESQAWKTTIFYKRNTVRRTVKILLEQCELRLTQEQRAIIVSTKNVINAVAFIVRVCCDDQVQHEDKLETG